MKIIFFGTPGFGIPTLQKLFESKHEICSVVTAPDKEQGRGRQVSYSPIKSFAVKNNIPVLQPEKLKDNLQLIDDLKLFHADLFVVVAFKILPSQIFTLPMKGSINLHASLLPKYRGAAPIQWALINGENETGLTTFFLQEKVDTGNVIVQKNIKIEDEDDFGSLYERMSEIGAEVVYKTVELIDSENVNPTKQNDSLATPAPKITKEMCMINWNDTAANVRNLIRGLSPMPGAYFEMNGKRYKIYKAMVDKNLSLSPSEVKQTTTELWIGCLNSSLKILEIQLEGRKRMSTEEFLRGYSLI